MFSTKGSHLLFIQIVYLRLLLYYYYSRFPRSSNGRGFYSCENKFQAFFRKTLVQLYPTDVSQTTTLNAYSEKENEPFGQQNRDF